MFNFIISRQLFCLIAISLPSSQLPDHKEPATAFAKHFLKDLVSLSIQHEIMDKREMSFLFCEERDYPIDIDILRKRFADLRDAPMVSDAIFLPNRDYINTLTSFNRSYLYGLSQRLNINLSRREEIRLAIKETELLYEVWDAARDASCEYYYVQVRRAGLKKLKCLIGEDAYYSGALPPPIPTWRFQVR